MPKAQHTPGPWYDGGDGYVWDAPEGRVDREIVCDTADTKRGKADAALIANAPAMLEALKIAESLVAEALDVHVYDGAEKRDPDCAFTAGLGIIRAAIAKATA